MKRAYTESWLDGVALGALLATILFLTLFIAIDASPSEVYHQYVIAFLVTVGSLFAASLAILGVKAQIRSSLQMAEERRIRSLRAAAAMLPQALSKFSHVCQSNIRRHFQQANLTPDGAALYQPNLVEADDDTFAALRECVLYVDESSYERLLYLFRAYQVLIARGNNLIAQPLLAPGVTDLTADAHSRITDVINWAVLDAATLSMFRFARGQDETIRVHNPDSVLASMFLSGVLTDQYPLLQEIYLSRLDYNRLGLRFTAEAD